MWLLQVFEMRMDGQQCFWCAQKPQLPMVWFPWDPGLLPVLVEPPEMIELMPCSTSASSLLTKPHPLRQVSGHKFVFVPPPRAQRSGCSPSSEHRGTETPAGPPGSPAVACSQHELLSHKTQHHDTVPRLDWNPGLPAANSIANTCFLLKAA